MRSLPLISLVACLSAPGVASAAEAQRADAANAGKAETPPITVKGSDIIVTAPRIVGEIDAPQPPVAVFTEEDIASYGVSSIEELLDAISPETGSGRGRGSGSPVILLNGQRIASFREMRGIPPEAIRRVEVLPEEVALRFGYSPDQRVVNIILKDKFNAVTAAGEYNRPTRGGYDNYELQGGLFKIAGPRRFNINGKLDNTSMLTEAERDITQDPSRVSQVASDLNPGQYRSLLPDDSELTLEGSMTQGLGEKGLGGSITATGGYTRSLTTALSGLDTVSLGYDGTTLRRTLPDPLASRTLTNTVEGGFGYNTMFGQWQFNATSNPVYTDAITRTDRRRDTEQLVAAAAAGQLDIAGALPTVASAGVDVARNRELSISNLATLTGKPFRMPAGDANLTVKGGYIYDQTWNENSRNTLGSVSLTRGDVQGGVNLALPLTSKADDFLGAVGDITLNLSAGLDQLSDFGTLTNWSVGTTWSPTSTLTFQASYIVAQAAPKLSQLSSPTILTYNVPVYDFNKGVTALVTTTSGGNPNLKAETQRDWKISAQWKLPFFQRSNILVEYFRNHSSNVTQSFPLLTSAIESAFADRVTRDDAGNLLAIDQRAVTFSDVRTSSLRWGFNISGSLGSSASTAAEGSGRGGGASIMRMARNADTPVAPVTGPNGPMPGAATEGQPTGVPGAGPQGERRHFDPARFAALRQQLCAPGAADPDPATLPEGLRQRMMGADGKLDPAKLAAFKQRACSADGGAPGSGEAQGQRGPMDPQRFEAIRAALCANTSGPPDVASLPERMRERLLGPDGKIDPDKLATMRARFCTTDGAPAGGMPPPPPGADEPPPPPPPPSSSRDRNGPGGSGIHTAGLGGGRGPGGGMGGPGMGGPPGGGPGGPGGRGSRWNLSVYHTWRFTDTVSIAPGVPVLDQLNGDAIAAGGVPRHAIEAEGGLFKNGYGLRLKAEWESPARVNGTSQNLRFGSTFDVSLRLFADLGRNEALVAKMPFLKGARLSLVANNLLDSRQRVTDQNGLTPLAYQPAYRTPQGRVLGIDLRKVF
ncbi:TonB-dependent receptor plug domain-containing protein [Novosphingobium sp. Leaf2]|uniref:TonB-dependent receptor plug domain-containing protein n=1 Tax=Novosphingobium sp. Leaf2 TaxID=1735670 RepID=UPI0006F301AF|nr:TonB-dependent receptor plug domain-containing protein [Novosphingobium sp. Leaf2]KQM13005.1 hypothetical protein ASE49_13505 [Novosphingobium sp. Leaf2]